MPKYAIKYRPRSWATFYGNEDLVSTVQEQLKAKDCPQVWLITGATGCVDAATEFLTPVGWKRIDKYHKNDVVAQYQARTNKIEFVIPKKYIVLPETSFYHIKTKYGLDQMLSSEHRVLYTTSKLKSKKNEYKFKEITMTELANQHQNSEFGFKGLFPTSFTYNSVSSLNLSEYELRLMVAVIADGNFAENRNNTCINIKKQRKIERLKYLLSKADVKYKTSNVNGFTRFYFIPPFKAKCFDERFWACSDEQRTIIADECLKWDGFEKSSSFFTRNKKSADFIQMVFTAQGFRSKIGKQFREDGSIDYVVNKTDREYVGISKSKGKLLIKKIKSVDGKKYCFEVSSSYLVLRRKGCVFITGNSGKTTLARIMAKEIMGLETKEKLLNHSDYNEENVGKNRSKEYMEELMEGLRYKPMIAKNKVLVLDECHQLLGPAASVLLKPLEDIGKSSHVIMITNEPEKLLKTLKDRATVVNLQPLDEAALAKLIFRIGKAESLAFCSKEHSLTLAKHFAGETRRCLDVLQSLSVKFAKEKTVNIEALNKEVATALDADMVNASKFLIALYTGQPAEACQISQKFENYQYLLRNLLDLNNFLLENVTQVSTYVSFVRKDLIKALGKKTPAIENIVTVQEMLFELKKDQNTVTIVEPKQAMLVFAAKAVLSQV